MKVRVTVMPKTGVLDPQGKAIGHALGSLGFDGVGEVRAGKVIELTRDESDASYFDSVLTVPLNLKMLQERLG